ncbi:hypothetical protein ACQ86F_08915 [Streptomyces venezuelae ATCC 10712]
MDTQVKVDRAFLGPRAAVVCSLVITLLLAALSGLVMRPAAQHLRSLREGVRTEATLVAAGSGCFLGGCKVRFEAEGRIVVADLPLGSSDGDRVTGDGMTIRYKEVDPQVVASQDDVGGGGPSVATVMFGAGAVLFLLVFAGSVIRLVRQRRAVGAPAPAGAV